MTRREVFFLAYFPVGLMKTVDKGLWIEWAIVEFSFFPEKGRHDSPWIDGFQCLPVDGRRPLAEIHRAINALQGTEPWEINLQRQTDFYGAGHEVFDKMDAIPLHFFVGIGPQPIKDLLTVPETFIGFDRFSHSGLEQFIDLDEIIPGCTSNAQIDKVGKLLLLIEILLKRFDYFRQTFLNVLQKHFAVHHPVSGAFLSFRSIVLQTIDNRPYHVIREIHFILLLHPVVNRFVVSLDIRYNIEYPDTGQLCLRIVWRCATVAAWADIGVCRERGNVECPGDDQGDAARWRYPELKPYLMR
jgi:hypothetical protein